MSDFEVHPIGTAARLKKLKELAEKAKPMLPLKTIQRCEDYCDVDIGDDSKAHSSQAMTMNPEHWDALDELLRLALQSG